MDQKDCIVDARTKKHLDTALTLAAANNRNSGAVELLLERKASPFLKNALGLSALTLAASHGSKNNCRLLVKNARAQCMDKEKGRVDDTEEEIKIAARCAARSGYHSLSALILNVDPDAWPVCAACVRLSCGTAVVYVTSL